MSMADGHVSQKALSCYCSRGGHDCDQRNQSRLELHFQAKNTEKHLYATGKALRSCIQGILNVPYTRKSINVHIDGCCTCVKKRGERKY
eukprot:2465399-Pleurochrysis_carterae.AAC.2